MQQQLAGARASWVGGGAAPRPRQQPARLRAARVRASHEQQQHQQQLEQPQIPQQPLRQQLAPSQANGSSGGALEQQRLQQQRPQGFQTRWDVPWDVWAFIRVAAAVWVLNQTIPVAVLSGAAQLQGVQLSELPLTEKELLNLGCQLAQLAGTAAILSAAMRPHQPLPPPWWLLRGGAIPVLQGAAGAIAAVGSGVLLSGFLRGHVDGAEEWRHLAGLHADTTGTLALAIGAVLLAPLLEECYFRGFILPSLTKWMHPLAAVPVTGLLFGLAHPSDALLPEALLGTILSLCLLAADGNLLVPLLAHAFYNSAVLGIEFLL